MVMVIPGSGAGSPIHFGISVNQNLNEIPLHNLIVLEKKPEPLPKILTEVFHCRLTPT